MLCCAVLYFNNIQRNNHDDAVLPCAALYCTTKRRGARAYCSFALYCTATGLAYCTVTESKSMNLLEVACCCVLLQAVTSSACCCKLLQAAAGCCRNPNCSNMFARCAYRTPDPCQEAHLRDVNLWSKFMNHSNPGRFARVSTERFANDMGLRPRGAGLRRQSNEG